jgi:UDP-glucose 4-epimerase
MEWAPAGATYNVGGGEEATMLEAITLLEEVSQRSLAVRRTEVARGDMARTSADVTRIRDQLGWEPRTSLRDGLQAEWSWCSARVAAG